MNKKNKGPAEVKAKDREALSLPREDNKELSLNSFFAGIGGFELGFRQAGFETNYYCEKDPFCRSVLARHWPDLKNSSDITEIDTSEIPPAVIWTGGFPCQDVSVARGWLGRDGLKGHRSGLFYTFLDLVKARKPQIVLLENVTGLLNSHDGHDFKIVIDCLASAGYGVAWRVMNSRYFGAPQSRPRVYICAWLGSVERAVQCLFEPEPAAEPKGERRGFLEPSVCTRTGAMVPKVAYCLAATSGRHTGTDWSRTYVAYEDRVRRLTPVECEGLQGFPADWTLPGTDVRKSVDDIDTARYHALGNAVCVPVVAWIARRVRMCLEGQFDVRNIESLKRTELKRELLKLIPHRAPASPRLQKLPELQDSLEVLQQDVRWRTGGCACRDLCVDVAVSSSPTHPIPSQLIDVIEKRDVGERYFVSPNAAEGMLRRVRNNDRTLFLPLQRALEILAAQNVPTDRLANDEQHSEATAI